MNRRENAARFALVELRARVFKDLSLKLTPRTEAVFDTAVAFCMWSIVDQTHTKRTVLPYLRRVMKTFMAQGYSIHLDNHGN